METKKKWEKVKVLSWNAHGRLQRTTNQVDGCEDLQHVTLNQPEQRFSRYGKINEKGFVAHGREKYFLVEMFASQLVENHKASLEKENVNGYFILIPLHDWMSGFTWIAAILMRWSSFKNHVPCSNNSYFQENAEK